MYIGLHGYSYRMSVSSLHAGPIICLSCQRRRRLTLIGRRCKHRRLWNAWNHHDVTSLSLANAKHMSSLSRCLHWTVNCCTLIHPYFPCLPISVYKITEQIRDLGFYSGCRFRPTMSPIIWQHKLYHVPFWFLWNVPYPLALWIRSCVLVYLWSNPRCRNIMYM